MGPQQRRSGSGQSVRGWLRLPRPARKLIGLAAVLLVVSFATFMLINLIPGDPATAILQQEASPEALAALRADLGLDQPLLTRYLDWLGGVLQGDLGRGYKTNQPVLDAILQRLPVTVELIVLSQVVALAVAVPLGIATAYRAGSRFDRLTTVASFTLLALPNFVLGLVLIYVFGVQLDWFPPTGYTPLSESPMDNLRSVTLPTITLAAGSVAVYQRMLRTEMASTLREDFVMVARARGVPVRRVLLHHAFRPSAFSLVTVVGLTIGNLIGGALVVEAIFGLPGMGRLLVDAILAREYVVVQGVVGFIAVGYVVIGFLIDLVYTVLDPRVRHA